MKSFTVNLENRQTEVFIDSKPDFSGVTLKAGNSLLVTDKTMASSGASGQLADAGLVPVVLGAGERYKNIESITTIAAKAVEAGLDRGALIIGLGGGVICDMAAFAASVYMRGCGLVLVPTTLLSMVDASIGGKTGVDFMERKNLLGSFYPAEKVYVFTEFLDTLPENEYKSGLAEIIKHGLLSDNGILELMETQYEKIMAREPELSAELIFRSLKVKAEYIEKDFRENGCRAHLNLGHTFGHALETAAGLGAFSHGEAVAWGIQRAMKAGLLAGTTDSAYASRVEKILRKYNYNIDYNDFNHELFMEAISSDKKKREGRLRFVLQRNLGNTEICLLEPHEIEETLRQ